MSQEARWYVVHTYSGYENKVKEDLEKSLENAGLQDIILEVKYNRVLPPYLADVLSFACPEAVQSAVSKYTLCRRYEGKE